MTEQRDATRGEPAPDDFRDPLIPAESQPSTTHTSLVERLDTMVAVLMDKTGELPIPDDCNVPALMHEAAEVLRCMLSEIAERPSAVYTSNESRLAHALREFIEASKRTEPKYGDCLALAEWTLNETSVSAIRESVTIPRSLAERSHAMFQSVDPSGGIASEWRDALNLPRYP